MNRIVVLGVAIFFALAGIALVGGEQQANAALFGCVANGCNGCSLGLRWQALVRFELLP